MSKDNVLNVLQQSEEKHDRFLAAWKQGIEFIGPELFGPGKPATATDKNQLCPHPDEVEKAFIEESCGEEQFLAAMVSFYDPAWGEELVARIDSHKSLCGLTYNLDHECTEIVCELLRNYTGWDED
jgi:hypothetical protein